jgi:hypothetical protein
VETTQNDHHCEWLATQTKAAAGGIEKNPIERRWFKGRATAHLGLHAFVGIDLTHTDALESRLRDELLHGCNLVR